MAYVLTAVSRSYCSKTRCGRGCTRAEYEDAVRRADSAAVALGPQWQAQVWENLGWHAKAVIPGEIRIEVHANTGSPETFTALLHHDWIGRGNTPAAALSQALHAARDTALKVRQIAACVRTDALLALPT